MFSGETIIFVSSMQYNLQSVNGISSAFAVSHRGEGLLKTTQDLFHQAEVMYF